MNTNGNDYKMIAENENSGVFWPAWANVVPVNSAPVVEAEPVQVVIVDGPYAMAGPRSDWDEYPEYPVFIAIDGEPVGKIYHCGSYARASELGENIANDQGLELINEAVDFDGRAF